MKAVVIDTSAILALIQKESGYDFVEKYINSSVISTVNFAETLIVLNRNGFNQKEVEGLLEGIVSDIAPFDQEQACIASNLDSVTKQYGLSLGDKSCIALGIYRNLPILTADKLWTKLNIDQEIILIR